MVKVTGAIIEQENLLLIGRRGSNESSPGLWEFPGGKVEMGETLHDCIKRELKEELNIDARVGDVLTKYVYHGTNMSYDLTFFRIIDFKGIPSLNAHDRLEWVPVNKLRHYEFLPGDEPLLKFLEKP